MHPYLKGGVCLQISKVNPRKMYSHVVIEYPHGLLWLYVQPSRSQSLYFLRRGAPSRPPRITGCQFVATLGRMFGLIFPFELCMTFRYMPPSMQEVIGGTSIMIWTLERSMLMNVLINKRVRWFFSVSSASTSW